MIITEHFFQVYLIPDCIKNFEILLNNSVTRQKIKDFPDNT